MENSLSNQMNSIILGDCIEVLRSMPSESVDLIFADPPYFMQTDGELLRSDGTVFAGVDDHWDKFSGYSEYDSFCFEWLKECKRVLKSTGSIWVIGAFQNIFRIGYIMQNLDYWILNDVVWSKPNAVPNFGGTRFQNSHETMLWCTKSKKSKFTFNYKTMKALNNNKQEKSVWDIGICIGSERIKDENGKKAHSTQKPEKLLYKIIAASTKPGDIVLDPFMGSGTTGAVAKSLGRNYIGIEREPNYKKIADKRIASVEYLPNEISELLLEVKPPRVSLNELTEVGLLMANEPFFDKHGFQICALHGDNKVSDGTEVLSIHKMAAKALRKDNHNGWDFFHVMRDNRIVSIDQLRYEYEKLGKSGEWQPSKNSLRTKSQD